MKQKSRQAQSLDLVGDVIAARVSAERFRHNLAAYRDVLREIEKLRRLDLTDVHPAVAFDPAASYREK